MHTELKESQFDKLSPLLEGYPQDPMLYAVLEGHRKGQIFVDNSEGPTRVFVWTGMEYAYLLGDISNAEHLHMFKELIETRIIPELEATGQNFVSVFPFYSTPSDRLIETFEYRGAVGYGVNIYRFDEEKFQSQQHKIEPMPDKYSLLVVDRSSLELPALASIRDDIEFCWDSTSHFLELGLGVCVIYQEQPVSACYAIGFGANAYHVTAWTHPDHRRKGLGKHAVMAFLQNALTRGKSVYWLNDLPNLASRKLAESVGFVHTTDLYPVDIPVHPGQFHLGLAEHFANYFGEYTQAGELYEKAFRFTNGDKGSRLQAARTWLRADQPEKAIVHLRTIITNGWCTPEELKEMDEFSQLSF